MEDHVSVLAMIIHHLDGVQVGVGPVHQLLDEVQGHSSGLLCLIVHQSGPVGAVHVAAFHLGHVPIVGEEEHSGITHRRIITAELQPQHGPNVECCHQRPRSAPCSEVPIITTGVKPSSSKLENLRLQKHHVFQLWL